MKEYWEILRELREDRDIKQSTIARVLSTTQQVYSRYENGINEMPIRHLRSLCRYYGVTADYVLGLEKESADESRKE
ncbi:MAG: helix-turn-helix transcriptional regulator [Clostridia bacterium]|nr:helix-turn-helix transcriptional regulator [Clostridia bacterium]